MTQRVPEFLAEDEISTLEGKVAQIFGVGPEDVMVAIEQKEVEIPDPFHDGARGKRPAQVITFAEDDFPTPKRVLLEVVVADAIFLGVSAVHRMPYATDLVRYAERLDKPDKLRRVIIDDNLAVLEFREPLSGWEAARLVRALALGWTARDIIWDEESGAWVAACYGYLQ
jgi:hypothetical protein